MHAIIIGSSGAIAMNLTVRKKEVYNQNNSDEKINTLSLTELVENRAGLLGKPVNAHPGSNVNQIITFSSMQMFLLLFCVYGDYGDSKQKAKQYTENLSAKLQNSNQNSTFSWVSLIGL